MDSVNALVLASAAYCDDIYSTVQNQLPGTVVVWCPDLPWGDNLCYVAFDGTDYIVAIRGSVLDFSWVAFDNWFREDFNVFEQVSWPYVSDSSAMIAQGAMDGFNELMGLVDSDSGQPVSLMDFLLGAIGDGQTGLWITGHSLGGNLATVLAPYIAYTFQAQYGSTPPMSVSTYAAPAAGNQAFANCFDGLFGNSSWRYYFDPGDIVPCFPVPLTIYDMSYWYNPQPSAPSLVVYDKITLQDAIVGIGASIGLSEVYNDSYYCQTNQTSGSIPLTSPCTATGNTIDHWFDLAACNHSKCSYLQALGFTGFKCTPNSSSEDCT